MLFFKYSTGSGDFNVGSIGWIGLEKLLTPAGYHSQVCQDLVPALRIDRWIIARVDERL